MIVICSRSSWCAITNNQSPPVSHPSLGPFLEPRLRVCHAFPSDEPMSVSWRDVVLTGDQSRPQSCRNHFWLGWMGLVGGHYCSSLQFGYPSSSRPGFLHPEAFDLQDLQRFASPRCPAGAARQSMSVGLCALWIRFCIKFRRDSA